jgi:CzcA family heavy metal efflux pump
MTFLNALLRDHAKAIILAFIMIAIGGFLAYEKLPSDVYPELSFPRIAVIATASDTAPERLLLSVTRPLEEAASQIYRVRWVRSKTIRGSTELSVEFQHGTDMIFALHQLQSRIAEAQSKLPPGVSLTIELVTPAIFPVLSYNVTTDGLTQADLYTISKFQIVPELSRITGVARVQIQGGDVPQVAVQVDPAKLKDYGLSLSQVADAIAKTNQIQVVGRVDETHQQNLIVARGEATSLSQIESLVIATKSNTTPVYLRDVASVSNGFADRTSIVSIGQKQGLVINIFRQPTANVVEVSKGVHEKIAQLKARLPLGVNLKRAYDESSLVNYAMVNVRDAILIGIALIVVVLFVFLRSWRTTLVAALTIPLSALAAFGSMYLLGQSLNLMSLGGLAVAIGLVIDDAIVVIENIHRQLQQCRHSELAVSTALKELIGPVTSSTATTVVVFLPLGLLSGVAGQFFTSLTITLAAAVIFSLVLALTVTPILAMKLLHGTGKNQQEPKPGWVSKAYGWILRGTFKAPILVFLAAGAICYTAYSLYGKLTSDFLPAVDEGNYVVDYLAPTGASLQDVNALALKLEKIISQTPEVLTYTRRTGAELGLFATQTNKGDILVVLKPGDKRHRKVDEIMEEQRKEIESEIPQLEIDFHQILQDQLNDLSGAPRPIEVRIFGEDAKLLRQYSQDLQGKIAAVKGVVDLTSTAKEGAPEIDLNIDPVKAGRLGLTAGEIAAQVQDSLLGRIASQIRQGDRLVDIRVRLNDTTRLSPDRLADVPIVAPNSGATLPLSAVAAISRHTGENAINCENQQRYVSIEGDLEGRDLGSAVAEIKHRIANFKMEPGYSVVVAGLYATQQETFAELVMVLLLASVLVYLLLVIQFRSFLQPLAIFVAVPLAMFGVELALLITKTPLNVSSFMGIILLVGLVVKNGIILLEYTNRLRSQGVSIEDALVQAGSVRLRPIVMTTLCTLLGLLPLAWGLGTGAELQKPLAVAVIGGLSLSTILTLVFVPVIFRALEHLSGGTKRTSKPREESHDLTNTAA